MKFLYKDYVIVALVVVISFMVGERFTRAIEITPIEPVVQHVYVDNLPPLPDYSNAIQKVQSLNKAINGRNQQ